MPTVQRQKGEELYFRPCSIKTAKTSITERSASKGRGAVLPTVQRQKKAKRPLYRPLTVNVATRIISSVRRAKKGEECYNRPFSVKRMKGAPARVKSPVTDGSGSKQPRVLLPTVRVKREKSSTTNRSVSNGQTAQVLVPTIRVKRKKSSTTDRSASNGQTALLPTVQRQAGKTALLPTVQRQKGEERIEL